MEEAIMTNQEELDEILDEMQMANPGGELKAQEEAKAAINSLTLKQVMRLIGPDEEIKPWISDAGGIRNIYRQSLRESAERIWS